MRFLGVSLAAAGLSSLFASIVIAHAVLAPVPHKEAAPPPMAKAVQTGWTTTVTRY